MTIISLGAAYLDINSTGFPIPTPVDKLVGTETVGGAYEMVLGGSAVNFVRFCKALGLEAAFIGKTGTDSAGQLIKEYFAQEGIQPVLTTDPNLQTNMNVNLVSETGSSIMLSFGNANQALAPDNVLANLERMIDQIDIVYLGGVFKLKALAPAYPQLVSLAKQHGKKVVLDHGRVVNSVTDAERTMVKELISQVDIYLPSNDELLELWGGQTIDEAVQHVRQHSAAQLVVKNGAQGAVGYDGDTRFEVPAFKVTVVNTIGAGDCFNAGFMTGLSQGLAFADSIKFGCAASALKISQPQLPTLDQVRALST